MNTTRICIFVGSGGVGKTTSAAALAVQMAEAGEKVLILTIDPSQRLATTLGMDLTQDLINKVDLPSCKGSLSAAVIHHKQVFDDFVKNAAKDSGLAQKIFANHLYQQLSTNLSGSQEFTSLEKLYSAYESGKYDVIVLDTPPAQHAVDFLNAPQKLTALFNESVSKWFRTVTDITSNNAGFSVLKGLMAAGTKQVLKALEALTGSDFISQLADFFSNIQTWQSKLEARTIEFHRMLVSPHTYFVLVTCFDEAKLKEAEQFAKEIRQSGYQLKAIIMNRAFPEWTLNDEEKIQLSPAVKDWSEKLTEFYAKRTQLYKGWQSRLDSSLSLLQVPDFSDTISDLEALKKMTKYLAPISKIG